jgi:ABC-type antimicrobial peptide transport system permease subunit
VLGLLSGFFGVLALLLAGLGLYGIVTYMTARRRGEIGVRIALGAESGRVVRMVLGEAGSMVLLGIGVGVALSLALTRLVAACIAVGDHFEIDAAQGFEQGSLAAFGATEDVALPHDRDFHLFHGAVPSRGMSAGASTGAAH